MPCSASGWDDLSDVEERLEALRAVRPTENFEPLAAGFKRIRNILQQAEFTPGDASIRRCLKPGPRRNFYETPSQAQGANSRRCLTIAASSKPSASLRPAIDLFFDKVMVNADDPAVRQNRLTLLAHHAGRVFNHRRFFRNRNIPIRRVNEQERIFLRRRHSRRRRQDERYPRRQRRRPRRDVARRSAGARGLHHRDPCL